MNNIFAGVAIAVPVTALALLLLLQGKEEVRTDQDLHRTEMQIDKAKFDEEFARGWGGDKEKLKPDSPEARRMARLEKQRDDLEAKKSAQTKVAEADTQSLREALNDQGARAVEE